MSDPARIQPSSSNNNNNEKRATNGGSPVKLRTIARRRSSTVNHVTTTQKSFEISIGDPEFANDFQRPEQPQADHGPDLNGRRPIQEKKKTNGSRKRQPSSTQDQANNEIAKKSKEKLTVIVVPELVEKTYHNLGDERKELDNLIFDYYEKNCLTYEMLEELEKLVKEFECELIRGKICDARLEIYGSAKSGCGTRNCDIDIRFRLKEDVRPERFEDKKEIVKVLFKIKAILSKRYKKNKPTPWFWVIWKCRVPIVTFKLKGREGDISFYNDDAAKNTTMFTKYCEWEPERFPQLVLFVKRWAKDCGINSSKNGTLTSYALSLMLAHFLQQCSPPVLPPWNLDQDTIPEGYDFGKVPVINNWSKNKETVGQLFVGFLDYYSRFDFNKLISILRKDLVDKNTKKFLENLTASGNTKQFELAIEDPYEREYNPGYAVKNNLAKIRAVFCLSREVFMGKCEELVWDKSLIERCTSSKSPVVESDPRATMVDRVLKAVVYCGGACTLNELKYCYNVVNKTDYSKDTQPLYGAGRNDVFTHPLLKKCVIPKKNGSFKLIYGLYEEVAALVDRLSGFNTDDTKKTLEEGVRRFLKIIRRTPMNTDWGTFLTKYKEHFAVKFDEEERLKYFGTSDIDAIVEIVRGYGLQVSSNAHHQPLFSVKPDSFHPNAVEMKTLFDKIYSTLMSEDEIEKEILMKTASEDGDAIEKDILMKAGINRLKTVLGRFPPNSPIRQKTFRNIYRKLYSVPYLEGSKKYFGTSTFYEVMALLKEHKIDVTKMKKGVFSYTMNSLIGRKLTIQNSSEKPNLQQKCDSHVQRVQAKADQYGQRVSSNQREENDSPKCQNPRFGAPAKKRTARKRKDKGVVPDQAEIAHHKLDDERKHLDLVIADVYKNNCLTEQKRQECQKLVDEFQQILGDKIPGVSLGLFGSVVNGCGSDNSKMDINVRCQEDIPAKEQIKILNKIKNVLTKKYKKTDSQAIKWQLKYRSKVPTAGQKMVINFKQDGNKGGISFYSDIALRNSALLSKYCEWAPDRFPQLAMSVKKWAKACNINSSKNGTLTSYALSLMLVHFLQQCSPPVLPPWNLDQDTVDKDYDFGKAAVISNWSENKESVGQLFVRFLDYYSRFDFSKLISILRNDLIDKNGKFTDFNNNKLRQFAVAIEDPYHPNFNPGHTVHHSQCLPLSLLTKFFSDLAKIRAIFHLSRAVFMGKCEDLAWDELMERCTSIDKREMTDFEKEQLRTNMAHRVFKAIVCCRGEATLEELKSCYGKLIKSKYNPAKRSAHGINLDMDIFTHPFLRNCILEENGIFKLTDELYEEVVEKLYGFSGNEADKMVEEGARRFLKVIRQTPAPMAYDTFLVNYTKLYEVEFDEEEMKKYFDTSDMDEIVEKLSAYGLQTTLNDQRQSLYGIKPVQFLPQFHGEVNQLIPKIYARLIEDEDDSPMNVGIDRLKEILTRFSPNFPFSEKAFRNIYRKLYSVPYSVPERKYFGRSTFYEVMLLLKEHGIDVRRESKGIYSYVMQSEAADGPSIPESVDFDENRKEELVEE